MTRSINGSVLRRWVSTVLFGALMSTGLLVVPAGAQESTYTDVPEGVYYTEPVSVLRAAGVFEGTECAPSRFCPEQSLKRWEMAVWLVRALSDRKPSPLSSARFSDVSRSTWYAPHVEQMFQLGVTTGCGDGTTFCPDKPVTRAQMAVFLTRAYKWKGGGHIKFADVSADAWYAAQVKSLAHYGVTTGCGRVGTHFCPAEQVTRGQMATFLHRASTATAGGGRQQTSSATTGCVFSAQTNRLSKAVYKVRASGVTGTAFYIGNNEWLTAEHVVTGKSSVTLVNEASTISATVKATDRSSDLALLTGSPASETLTVGDPSSLSIAEEVWALGYPLDSAGISATKGIVSRFDATSGGDKQIVTDAAVNPGNSGGPLMDVCGTVFGVISAKQVGADIDNIGYATVIDSSVLKKLRTTGISPAGSGRGTSTSNGSVEAGWVSGRFDDGNRYAATYVRNHLGARDDDYLLLTCNTDSSEVDIYVAAEEVTPWDDISGTVAVAYYQAPLDFYLWTDTEQDTYTDNNTVWGDWIPSAEGSALFAPDYDTVEDIVNLLRLETGYLLIWGEVGGSSGDSWISEFPIKGAETHVDRVIDQCGWTYTSSLSG